jgi:SapC
MTIKYENPIRLTGAATSRRIFSPLAYHTVRQTNVVPAVIPEAWALASWFPIVWQRIEGRHQLVAVRSLLADGRGYLAAVERSPGLLPLILQSYPFLLDPTAKPDANAARWIDDVIADSPSDIGAPVLLADKRPTKATRLRLGMLDLFQNHWAKTQSLALQLEALELFEPWKLTFDVNGRSIGVDDLFIVRQTAFDTGALAPVAARHGAVAAQFLALHRISLFRAGSLLSAARVAEKNRAAAPAGSGQYEEAGTSS